jgi:hypothetical protein
MLIICFFINHLLLCALVIFFVLTCGWFYGGISFIMSVLVPICVESVSFVAVLC